MKRPPKIRQRHAIPATLTSLGWISREAPLCAGPADALTGWRRYREVYLRGREKWGVRTSLKFCVYAYRYGVVLSGSPHGSAATSRVGGHPMTARLHSLALLAIIGASVRSIVRARRHLRLAVELDGDAGCGDLCPCWFAGDVEPRPAPGVYGPEQGR